MNDDDDDKRNGEHYVPQRFQCGGEIRMDKRTQQKNH